MARVTHVKRAQQRYATVPVLDENGEPRITIVRNRNGEPRTTKSGRPVTRAVTREDKSKPLPNLVCEVDQKEIRPGDPYKWIAPRSGPYGGRKRIRCGTCPTWQVWEYSSSLSARLAEIDHNARHGLDETDVSAVVDALRSAAEEIRSLAEEKREGAENIRDGFGHDTSMSEELDETASSLDTWADEIEQNADELETAWDEELFEYVECEECGGEGLVDHDPDESGANPDDDGAEYECLECDGSGEVENERYSEMLDAIGDALSVLDESPV